jgi:hypothetical protein
MIPITLIQTACGSVYEAMLAATEQRHRTYCAANSVEFQSFVGVRRGFYPWQATFNRIEMLNDLAELNHGGWVIYLDADAVIRQLDFDLRRFLGKRDNHALIAVAGGPERWNINAGVFFLNLGTSSGREILRRWRNAFHTNVTERMLADAVEPWAPLPDGQPFPDDQHLLQMELLRDERLQSHVLHEDPRTINHRGAKFIRQFLRSHGSPEQRLAWVEATALTP